MKKLLFLILLCASELLFAQTDGMRYQTVILDPAVQALPGENLPGVILPNREVQLRFTIFDDTGEVEFQEVQNTRTDAFGQIDVLIGQGQAVDTKFFTSIQWDGTPKNLQVEVRLDGQFNLLSDQSLTFIPYAFHRDITATGTVTIDGKTYFKDNLVIDGRTDFNGELSVNNASETNLSGTLTVDGNTKLHELEVANQSPTSLSGTLRVVRPVTLKETLDVDGATHLKTRLTVENTTTLNNTLDVDGAATLDSTLDVFGITTLNNSLRVKGQSPTQLTGNLTVDGITNLNSAVHINNGSTLFLSGDFNIDGVGIFNGDLTVNGETNLNGLLSVNNTSPTKLLGSLSVFGRTTLQNNLDVLLATNLENLLRVNSQNPTALSGTLTVGLATNLNGPLNVRNQSLTTLTGPLNTQGLSVFKDDLQVAGVTNLNGALNVNNASETALSGNLRVDGPTQLIQTLTVDGVSTFNNNVEVANGSLTNLSGTLEVDGASTFENTLVVTGQNTTTLNGTLTVDDLTLLNNDLSVVGNSNLSGKLIVTEATQLNSALEGNGVTKFTGTLQVDQGTALNDLEVANSSPTLLSGSLQVDGASTLTDILTVGGATTVDNSLTVTGAAAFTSLTSSGMSVQGNNTGFVATFDNLNTQDGDGILIKLGRNHGAWDGNSTLSLPNPIASDLTGPLAVLQGRLQNPGPNPFLTVSEVIQLLPATMRTGSVTNVNNLVFEAINRDLGLPIAFPSLNMPGRILNNEIVFYGGTGRVCSGQSCFSICVPFAGCTRICVPPVNVCVPSIPRIAFPGVSVPTIPIPTPSLPNLSNYVPALPSNLPIGGLPNVNIPTIATASVNNSLTQENEYLTFMDMDNRKTGSVQAQSVADFAENTIFDNVYMLDVLSEFIGVDLAEGVAAGIVAMTSLIDEYNEIGVSYSSGNGDYAEWLERINAEEYITSGDIVGVLGGKITKDLTAAEQIMVVSHKPIVLGNAPEEGEAYKGNTVAFKGQVPVKVMGAVRSGDYIVAHPSLPGYGVAKCSNKMKSDDFTKAVGRAWEENLRAGPKMVNTVIGVQNGDWNHQVNKVEDKQLQMNANLDRLRQQLDQIEERLNNSEKEVIYAGNH